MGKARILPELPSCQPAHVTALGTGNRPCRRNKYIGQLVRTRYRKGRCHTSSKLVSAVFRAPHGDKKMCNISVSVLIDIQQCLKGSQRLPRSHRLPNIVDKRRGLEELAHGDCRMIFPSFTWSVEKGSRSRSASQTYVEKSPWKPNQKPRGDASTNRMI